MWKEHIGLRHKLNTVKAARWGRQVGLTCGECWLQFLSHVTNSAEETIIRHWGSGNLARCHRAAPGSIPGCRIFASFGVVCVYTYTHRCKRAGGRSAMHVRHVCVGVCVLGCVLGFVCWGVCVCVWVCCLVFGCAGDASVAFAGCLCTPIGVHKHISPLYLHHHISQFLVYVPQLGYIDHRSIAQRTTRKFHRRL